MGTRAVKYPITSLVKVKGNDVRVTVEVLPWLSELLGGTISGKVVLRPSVSEGESLRDLLDRLCQEHPRFGRRIYDPTTRRLTGQAEIALNGSIYDLAGGLDARLREGDTITFLPGIAGGG